MHGLHRPSVEPRRVVITGANGYVGRRLVRAARERGLDVVACMRRPRAQAAGPGIEARRYELAADFDCAEIVAGADAVIHLAAILSDDSRPAGEVEDRNVAGSRNLLRAARDAGVRRFVFLSSQSAAASSPTRYGRSKWEVEQLLSPDAGELAVRAGLVCGGAPRALYGRLLRLCRDHAVAPVLRPDAPVYPIHVDDLCALLLALLDAPVPRQRWIRAGAERSTRFADFLRTLARERLGRRIRLLPVPAFPVRVGLRLAGRLLPVGLRERVAGLIALPRMDPEAGSAPPPDLAPARPWADALAGEGRTRRLILEARTLTRYVLGDAPPPGVLRRYVRAVRAESDPQPLRLPGPVHRWPPLFRACEPIGGAGGRLRRRLAVATRIAEMTPEGAPRFHLYRRASLAGTVMVFGRTVLTEALLLPLRFVIGRRLVAAERQAQSR